MTNYRHLLTAAAFFALSLLPSALAWAGVDPRRGNYRLEISDGPAADGGPRLVRYYNSGRTQKGMFGPGWVTPFEARLSMAQSGALALYDVCSGADLRFLPDDPAASSGKGTGKESIRAASLADLPLGRVFRSERCGCQSIIRTADGFLHMVGDRESGFYDSEGRLAALFPEGEVITVNRDPSGRITQLRDGRQRTIAFTYNERGEAVRVAGWQGAAAEYTYDAKGDLVQASAPGSGAASYRYDERHTMTRYGRGEEDPQRISYWGADQGFRVRSFAASDGAATRYSYHVQAGDTRRYGTTVQELGAGEDDPVSVSYEYQERSASDGSNWLEKETVDYGDWKKETLYSEGNLPLSVSAGGRQTSFRYDGKRRLVTRERSDGAVVEVEYDVAQDKVSLVRSFDRSDPGAVAETVYRYDGQGKLVSARNSAGHIATIAYDGASSTIRRLTVGEHHLFFDYGKNDKPVRIEVQGLGALKVAYDETGEIMTTEAEGTGSTLALAITDAFSTLLELTGAVKAALDGDAFMASGQAARP